MAKHVPASARVACHQRPGCVRLSSGAGYDVPPRFLMIASSVVRLAGFAVA